MSTLTPNDMAQLPDLSGDYAVSPEQTAQFQKDGHIQLENLISKSDLAPYREAISQTTYDAQKDAPPMEERSTYGKAFLQTINLWTKNEVVKRFAFARRFAGIAAQLLGVQAVRMYHDQSLFKEAGGGFTPWHQDQYYWPMDTDNTITMWMPLVDVSMDMGPLSFASGSHKEGFLGHHAISDDSEALYDEIVKEKDYPFVSQPLNAGDATFHYGWTLHKAPGNHANICREAMTVIYFADGCNIMEPDNPNRENDLKCFFPGQKPGELAGGELTPVLYQA